MATKPQRLMGILPLYLPKVGCEMLLSVLSGTKVNRKNIHK